MSSLRQFTQDAPALLVLREQLPQKLPVLRR